jgi:hypothetical protein
MTAAARIATRLEGRSTWGLAAAAACLAVGGCGPSGGTPVSGAVTIKAAGPLDRGSILFVDDRITCRGEIASNGRYRITQGPTGGRVPPGRYKVQLIGTGTGPYTDPRSQVAHRLEKSETTDLVVDVPDNPAGVTLDFTVDPPGK